MKKFWLGCLTALSISLSSGAQAGQLDHVQWTAGAFAGQFPGPISDTKPFRGGTVTATVVTSTSGEALNQSGGTSVADATYPTYYQEPNGPTSWIGTIDNSANYSTTVEYSFSAGIPIGTTIAVLDLEGGGGFASTVVISALNGNTPNNTGVVWEANYYLPDATTNVLASETSWNATTRTLSANSTQYAGSDGNGLWLLTYMGGPTTGTANKIRLTLNGIQGDGVGFGLLEPVPEPTSMAIFGLVAGAAGFRSIRRRKNS